MVMGSGELGKFWHRVLEEEFKRFRDRLTFVWFDDLTLAELLRRCASLPDNSAIFYVMFATDAAGAAYADDRVFADLRRSECTAICGAKRVLGSGNRRRFAAIHRRPQSHTADVAIRLLNGAPPRSIRVRRSTTGQPMFDWRELQRWSIPESRLPSGSVVRYRVRACGANTVGALSAPACWPFNRS